MRGSGERGRERPLRFELAVTTRGRAGWADPFSMAATVIVLGAIAFVPLALWMRLTILVTLVAIAIAREVQRRERDRGVREWIELSSEGIARRRDGEPATVLVRWGERFGLTILSNRSRERALFALTTPDATRYVRVDLDGADTASVRGLLARSTLALDADVLLGESAEDAKSLRASDALRLVDAIDHRAGLARERLYLSDARGTEVALEDNFLLVGKEIVELDAPLEWRSFMFHEATGQMMTLYLATFVKQNGTELVFVSTMASELYLAGGQPLGDSEVARDLVMRRAHARDLRLLHSAPESPPPRELRIAIDRLFMLPLRHAIDRAPRITRTSNPPARSQSLR